MLFGTFFGATVGLVRAECHRRWRQRWRGRSCKVVHHDRRRVCRGSGRCRSREPMIRGNGCETLRMAPCDLLGRDTHRRWIPQHRIWRFGRFCRLETRWQRHGLRRAVSCIHSFRRFDHSLTSAFAKKRGGRVDGWSVRGGRGEARGS